MPTNHMMLVSLETRDWAASSAMLQPRSVCRANLHASGLTSRTIADPPGEGQDSRKEDLRVGFPPKSGHQSYATSASWLA